MPISRREFMASAVVMGVAACSVAPTSVEARTLWGSEGLHDGHFLRPRAIDICNDEVFVIDTTGRVQVFAKDGTFARMWKIPKQDNGTPTAVIHTPDNQHIILPDTHNSRILIYTPEGELVDQWGEYGTGTDQFIYPTGITRSAEGIFFISEYGVGADRVHVFDGAHQYLRDWKSMGESNGEFGRAMDIAMSRDGQVLVADTVHHRIQIFEQDGTFVSTFGGPGKEPGLLDFPYDIAVTPENTVLIAEYGNHRISHMTLDGTFLGAIGRAGRGSGEFNAPRGLCLNDSGDVYVADTDNHRVQHFRMEDFT